LREGKRAVSAAKKGGSWNISWLYGYVFRARVPSCESVATWQLDHQLRIIDGPWIHLHRTANAQAADRCSSSFYGTASIQLETIIENVEAAPCELMLSTLEASRWPTSSSTTSQRVRNVR
jgi:hypothetical protein